MTKSEQTKPKSKDEITEAEAAAAEKLAKEVEAEKDAKKKALKETQLRIIHYRVGFITGACGKAEDGTLDVNVPPCAEDAYHLGRHHGFRAYSEGVAAIRKMSAEDVTAAHKAAHKAG